MHSNRTHQVEQSNCSSQTIALGSIQPHAFTILRFCVPTNNKSHQMEVLPGTTHSTAARQIRKGYSVATEIPLVSPCLLAPMHTSDHHASTNACYRHISSIGHTATQKHSNELNAKLGPPLDSPADTSARCHNRR